MQKIFAFTLFSLFVSLVISEKSHAYRYFWDPNGICRQHPDNYGPAIQKVDHSYCRSYEGSHFAYRTNSVCSETPEEGASGRPAIVGRIDMNPDLCERGCFYPRGGDGRTMYCNR